MHHYATDISGVYLLESDRHGDRRGSFSRLFCADELATIMGTRNIVQINHSFSAEQGTIRGMHYQLPPSAETKIVRCMAGKIWDVVLDLRKGSPTLLQWRAFQLDSRGDQALLIPEGCAHGFQTLSENVQLLYFHTALYDKDCERGVSFKDPHLGIRWPLEPSNVSARDLGHPFLHPDFQGVAL